MKINYRKFIEENLTIIDKQSMEVPFKLNKIQAAYYDQMSHKDIILKARQEGFSSFILAIFFTDFMMKPNSNSVVVADKQDNAIALLERVKYYLKAFELTNKTKVPLRFNSKYQLVNAFNNATYTIGTAQESNFGRSRTLTNLHLSEAAFYPNLTNMLAGAAQAVVPEGRLVIETTANGFNAFKTLWDDSVANLTSYQPLFFKASMFYSKEFLRVKRRELGESMFNQEYPETPEQAFQTTGAGFFDKDALIYYLESVKGLKPLSEPHSNIIDELKETQISLK